jgi:hypothetical protein
METWTKDKVVELLNRNNGAVERAIIAIYNRQTSDEQSDGETKHSNGMGFSGAHSQLGTYYAKWILSGRHLNGSHLDKARKIVLRYTTQLLEVIQTKQAA